MISYRNHHTVSLSCNAVSKQFEGTTLEKLGKGVEHEEATFFCYEKKLKILKSMVKYSSEMASAFCKHSSVRDTGAVARRGYVLGTSTMLQVLLQL